MMADSSTAPLRYYGLLMIAAILATAWVWGRLIRKGGQHDIRLTMIYFWGLLGAFLGAKISFLIAEGWFYRGDWLALASGRSITGALIGGYAGVELGKKRHGYLKSTGDFFAIVAPLGILIGRAGCLLEGCCPGRKLEAAGWLWVDASGEARWPAALVELLFNALFLAWSLFAARRGWQPGNRFHVYLIAYGLFRFGHEFLRADQAWIGPLTGYHFWALALATFGAIRYRQRQKLLDPPVDGQAR